MNTFKEMGRVLSEAEASLTGMDSNRMFGFVASPAWSDRHRGALPDREAMARWLLRELSTVENVEMYFRDTLAVVQRQKAQEMKK